MDHEAWFEKMELYAVGALEENQLEEITAHRKAGCTLCEGQLGQIQELLTALPKSLTPLMPPASVKARLLGRIASISNKPEPPATGGWPPLWLKWGILAFGVLIGGSVAFTVFNQRAGRFAGALERLKQMEAGFRTVSSEERRQILEFLKDPRVRLIRLDGLPPSPNAQGQLLWNPETRRAIFLTQGLSSIPPEKVYELWAIAGEEAPVPAGTFAVDAEGKAFFQVPTLPAGKRFNKFAVTLEPSGGTPQPTGAMHLLGGPNTFSSPPG